MMLTMWCAVIYVDWNSFSEPVDYRLFPEDWTDRDVAGYYLTRYPETTDLYLITEKELLTIRNVDNKPVEELIENWGYFGYCDND